MRVKLYGTRGSIPIANRDSIKYGGNTTCMHLISDCVPRGHALVVDTGSGFVPLGHNGLEAGTTKYHIFYSHYHHDHTQGLLLAPPTFIQGIGIEIFGPEDNGWGPRQVVETLMRPPLFPVHLRQIGSRFAFRSLQFFESKIGVVHPDAGIKVMSLEDFNRAASSGGQIPFEEKKHRISECLLIRMKATNHPQATISYRFEEMPTGKSFVFLTDHEDVAGISASLKAHLHNADLLVADAQYDRRTYLNRTAGFGHGTPFGCVRLAMLCGCRRLGLTHHDPGSSDHHIDNIIITEATETMEQLRREIESPRLEEIFACWDYHEIDV